MSDHINISFFFKFLKSKKKKKFFSKLFSSAIFSNLFYFSFKSLKKLYLIYKY